MNDPQLSTTWPLYISSMPDGNDVPDNCGAVYDVSGLVDGRLMKGPFIQHYGVDIEIRSTDYQTGWAKIESLLANLDALNNTVWYVETETYLMENISQVGTISSAQEEGTKRRYLFSIGVRMSITEDSAAVADTSVRVRTGSNELTLSPAAVLADYIIVSLAKMTSPSSAGTWPLYISSMPDENDVPDNCGAIYDTTGLKDGRQMNGPVIRHYGIQLRIRSTDYQTGWIKIEDISSDLDTLSSEYTVNSIVYTIRNVSRTSPIVALGMEPGTARRFHFTMNYLVTIKAN